MANRPGIPSDVIQAVLDEITRVLGGDLEAIIQLPLPMTDQEWEEQLAEDERQRENLVREEAEWRAANPDAPQILAADMVDEDRGTR